MNNNVGFTDWNKYQLKIVFNNNAGLYSKEDKI